MDQSSNVHVRWNKHQLTLVSVFDALLDNQKLTDCTISAEGRQLRAHKIILSACSPVFEELFTDNFENHPIIILHDVKYSTIKALMNFMYRGEVVVPQEELSSIIKLSESLQIRGLSGSGCVDNVNMQKGSGSSSPSAHPETLPSQPDSVSCFSSSLNDPEENMQSFRESPPAVSSSERGTVRIDTFLPKSTRKYRHRINYTGGDEEAGQSTLREGFTPDFDSVHQLTSVREVLPTMHNMSKGQDYSPVLHRPAGSELQSTSGEMAATEDKQLSMPEEVLPDENSTNPSALQPLGPEETKVKVLMNQMEIVEDLTLDDSDDDCGDDCKSAEDGIGEFRTVSEGLKCEENFHIQENNNLCSPHGSGYWNTMTLTTSQTVLRNQFSCRACGKSYQYLRGLQRHIKYECAKKTQFQCPHCSYQCARNDNLKAHMASRRCQMQKKHALYQ